MIQLLFRKIIQILPLLLGLVVLVGCNQLTPPKQVYASYASREKIHLKVAVSTTDELRNFQWKSVSIGPVFAESAPILVQQTFSDFVLINSSSSPANDADAILIPKIVNAAETVGANGSGNSIISLKLEWTLNDAAGNIIWVDTFTGEGKGAAGSIYRADLLKDAYQQVLKRSQTAIWSSRVIREFAVKKYSDVKILDKEKTLNPEISEICENLSSAIPDRIEHALKQVRKMDAPQAVPQILPCLENPNPNIIRDACRTLAVLGNKDIIPYIEPLLKHKRKDVRKDAQDAIAKLKAKP